MWTGLGRVDLVEHRGQRRRLAAAGRAGDQDQAGFFLRDFLEDCGQAQALERRNFALQLCAARSRNVPAAGKCSRGNALRR